MAKGVDLGLASVFFHSIPRGWPGGWPRGWPQFSKGWPTKVKGVAGVTKGVACKPPLPHPPPLRSQLFST